MIPTCSVQTCLCSALLCPVVDGQYNLKNSIQSRQPRFQDPTTQHRSRAVGTPRALWACTSSAPSAPKRSAARPSQGASSLHRAIQSPAGTHQCGGTHTSDIVGTPAVFTPHLELGVASRVHHLEGSPRPDEDFARNSVVSLLICYQLTAKEREAVVHTLEVTGRSS